MIDDSERPSGDLTQVTLSVTSQMKRDIKRRLTYGDFLSGWVRQAVHDRMDRDDDGSDIPTDGDADSDFNSEITIMLETKTVEKIESTLGYGDSRSGWVREAIRQRLYEEDGSGPQTALEAHSD
jgi:hypothetical protein